MGCGNFAGTAKDLERAIARCGVILDVDWQDVAAVRKLAHEMLNTSAQERRAQLHAIDRRERAKAELYALALLMLQAIRKGAEQGVTVPRGPIWRSFGGALNDASEHRAT